MNSEAKSATRLPGLDVARFIAIAGMAWIHFDLVLSSTVKTPSFLRTITDYMAGRPATIFMLLAGMGVALRFSHGVDVAKSRRIKSNLAKRGLFFLVFGFLNLVIWPGDILRVYGVAYLAAAGFFATANNRWLLISTVAFPLTLIVTMIFIPFETNWNFETLEYANLWTTSGAMMNLFYNGFRAVLPWLGVFTFGIWLGRKNWTSPVFRRRILVAAFLVWACTETASYGLIKVSVPQVSLAEQADIAVIFGTQSLPALPLFLLSSCGMGTTLIAGCFEFCEQLNRRFYHSLASAGQLAFTWYIGHIVVIIFAGVSTGFAGSTPLSSTLFIWAFFTISMIATSAIYKRLYQHGPLEWMLRSITA